MAVPTEDVRLGPFKLDMSSAELHNNGTTTRLPEQPFQILVLLVEHDGAVVTREEIRDRLWQSGTFVDFEHGLNSAMKRLRHALGDSAENPRFIETLPRLGYRLMVPVERAAPASPARARVSISKLLIAFLVLLAVSALALALYVRSRPSTTRLTDQDTIVLSDFDNKTGDPVFDDTLKQGLSVQLEQSPFLTLVSERRVSETLKRMGHAGERMTPDLANEVCQRTGSKAMVRGSIAVLGRQYVIGLKALNCDTGGTLAETQEQAAGKEAVLKALDKAAVGLRSKLGESLSSVEKYATPLEDATTPSLEALKAYSLGRKTSLTKGNAAPLALYKRSVDLDPNFALAHAALSVAYLNLQEFDRASESSARSYELRAKVSERERFYIESNYYMTATGELEKAAQTDEMWKQTYPRDDPPYADLGFIYAHLGNWERASEEFRSALRLEPSRAINYGNLGVAYAALNRLEEAEATYKPAEEHQVEGEFMLEGRYWLAFLQGDHEGMARQVSAAMNTPGSEDLLLAAQADTEAWYGHLKNARELTVRAMTSAQHNNGDEIAAGYQAAAALRDGESGNSRRARAEADAALKLAPNRQVRALAALAFARAGDTARAESLASLLDKTFPVDTLIQRYWLPSIRAAVALERRDPKRAIELLKVASPIELQYSPAILYPAYVRACAYLMLRDGNRAQAEFQKFIDHRGLVRNSPLGALARCGLARSYASQGDTVKAQAAYRDFLALWKDADPDIPILKQAKQEYTKLQ